MSDESKGEQRRGGASIRASLTAVKDTPRYTYLVAALAAIGGMLFGYDIGVISGAENLLKTALKLSSATEELAVAAVLIGAVVGGVIGGPMADRFSRRYTLLAMAVLYALGAILTSISFDLASFVAFRILTGIAVGASSLVVPMYIAEMAPPRIRGGLVLMSAEVFPNRLRGAGASAATVANWSANLLITVTFLSLVSAVGKSWTFWIYAIFAALAVLFVARFVPETRGRPLESIDRYWTEGHRWPQDSTSQGTASPAGRGR